MGEELEAGRCSSCHRLIHPNELYGYNGLCSQCTENEEMGEHHGG